jgi:hypothetical protein
MTERRERKSIELRSDARARFERAVDVVAKGHQQSE